MQVFLEVYSSLLFFSERKVVGHKVFSQNLCDFVTLRFFNINFLEQIFWLSSLIFLKAMAPQGAFIENFTQILIVQAIAFLSRPVPR